MRTCVVIATYGDRAVWDKMADRALGSVLAQSMRPYDCQRIHADTLAEARNEGARNTDAERLVFLDADDVLDAHYVELMTEAMEPGLLLQPATQGFHPDGQQDFLPNVIAPRDLRTSNFMVIGTAIERERFLDLGGFHEHPCLEDWCLWGRAYRDGANVRAVPKAIYWVYVTESGRNLDRKAEAEAYPSIKKNCLAGWPSNRPGVPELV